MWKKEELAYLAGFIDGEGSLYIYPRKEGNYINYNARFQIANTDENVMKWIHTTFGGYLYKKERKNPKWRTQYEWCSGIYLLDILLPLLLPFLKIKHNHALIMIEFRNSFQKNKSRNTPEIKYFRNECLHKLRSLNSRGLK